MSRHEVPASRPVLGPARGWLHALGVVVAGFAVMLVVAALGLWLAGASELPQGAFVPVIAATVVMAVGGRVALDGGAGFIAETQAAVVVVPLSVALAGALVAAYAFLRPLRSHAVLSGGHLLRIVLRTALLWVLALLLIVYGARHSFTLSAGNAYLDEIAQLLGTTPTVGFHALVGTTVGLGLLWLLVVLLIALAVSRRVPLPLRLAPAHATVRPAVRAMVAVLLVYVIAAAIVALVTADTRMDAGDTLAVVFLGLPNLAWLAFGLGLGASWHGHVKGAVGLPMPEPLARVLRTGGDGDVTLDLASLTRQDGRAWWLLVAAAVAMLAAGWAAARRAPPGAGHLRNAVRLALTAAAAMLLIGLLTWIDAHYGLSLFGIGDPSDTGGLGGSVVLVPDLAAAVGLAAGWGAVTGLLGSLVARPRRRRVGSNGVGVAPGPPGGRSS
ncbi:streptophobe family protein [Streptomyces sp. MI02-7b]|uniref:streptophobe family protein n=1 Tax=Streptomyces sp. MI02-7b TaxID=462941 RepID=UPI0029A1B162|nr:streptophobe family protein [Streptomyces sp. MI02-7b]MDX3071411.1 streptophobe family protein [Streptomyces sp. MI02-7b]